MNARKQLFMWNFISFRHADTLLKKTKKKQEKRKGKKKKKDGEKTSNPNFSIHKYLEAQVPVPLNEFFTQAISYITTLFLFEVMAH